MSTAFGLAAIFDVAVLVLVVTLLRDPQAEGARHPGGPVEEEIAATAIGDTSRTSGPAGTGRFTGPRAPRRRSTGPGSPRAIAVLRLAQRGNAARPSLTEGRRT